MHGEDVRDVQVAREIELEDRHRAARVDEELALGPHVEHRRQVPIHRDIDIEIEPRRGDIHHAHGADIHAHPGHAEPETDVDIEAEGGVADRYARRAVSGGEAEEVELPADDGDDVVLPRRVLHTGSTVEQPADVGGVGHHRRILADRVIALVGGPGGVGLEAVEQGVLERARGVFDVIDDLVGDVDPLLLAGEVDHQPGADIDRQPRHVEAERDDDIAGQPARVDHHHTQRADPQQRR